MNGEQVGVKGLVVDNLAASAGENGAYYQIPTLFFDGLDYGEYTLTPVSYTHLDVYKRQVPVQGRPGAMGPGDHRSNLLHKHSPNGSADRDEPPGEGADAVSYTHLAVRCQFAPWERTARCILLIPF